MSPPYIVEDDEFERFCRDNLNYLIFMVGGRVAPASASSS